MFPSRSSPFQSNSLLPASFFGSNDPFFGAMSMFPRNDLMSEFFNMGFGGGENLNNIPNSSNGNCYVRTQTSFQSNYLDENGQPQREKYTSHQEFGVNDKNEKIFEKKEGYKHSGKGFERLAHEQMLDNEGRKIVREKGPDGNEQNATHYFNMSEDNNQEFNNKFRTVKSTFSNTPAIQRNSNREFNEPLNIVAERNNANYSGNIPLSIEPARTQASPYKTDKNEIRRSYESNLISSPSRPIAPENFIPRNETTSELRYPRVQSNISSGLNYSQNNAYPTNANTTRMTMRNNVPELRTYQTPPPSVSYSRFPNQPINYNQRTYVNQNPNIIRTQTAYTSPYGIQRGNYNPQSYY